MNDASLGVWRNLLAFVWGMIAGMALMQSLSPAHGAERVVASMYHEDTWVATGARFNKNKMAVAHKTLPFGTWLTLTIGTRTAVVVVNDRGPFIKGRTLDLTPAANNMLRCDGMCRVKMEAWVPPLPRERPIEVASVWQP